MVEGLHEKISHHECVFDDGICCGDVDDGGRALQEVWVVFQAWQYVRVHAGMPPHLINVRTCSRYDREFWK